MGGRVSAGIHGIGKLIKEFAAHKAAKNLHNVTLEGAVCSNPPSGKCKIINIYWDPDLKKMIGEYES